MTDEQFQKAKELRSKISYAKGKIKEYMDSEQFLIIKNPVKSEYYANKVNEWTIRLDNLRTEFKNL